MLVSPRHPGYIRAMDQADRCVQFILNGNPFELTRRQVERAVSGLATGQGHKFAVTVNGAFYPVKHVLEAATGVARKDFTSSVARKHLSALGFEIRGVGTSEGGAKVPHSGMPSTESAGLGEVGTGVGEWHTEAKVQSAVVAALVGRGWEILSVANTATKQHGIDVIAANAGRTIGVEVKGYPSKHYADPAKAGQPKATSPSTQAGHWYSQAVLAAPSSRNPIKYLDEAVGSKPCACGCGQDTGAGDFLAGHDQKALHARVGQIGSVKEFIHWFDGLAAPLRHN